jgi:multiple antibiotic resistance protein
MLRATPEALIVDVVAGNPNVQVQPGRGTEVRASHPIPGSASASLVELTARPASTRRVVPWPHTTRVRFPKPPRPGRPAEAGSHIRPLPCTVVQWRVFGETLVTLLVIMDPAGTTPIFVALTQGYTSRQSARAAVGAVGAAAGLILGFALFGRVILDYLHVSLESLSIAGGLLLLLVALEMLRGVDMAPPPGHDIALVPLATPLLAGPGAIATVMVLVRRNPGGEARLAVGATLLVAGRLARLVPGVAPVRHESLRVAAIGDRRPTDR